MANPKWIDTELTRRAVLANAADKRRVASEPRAAQARYDAAAKRVVIALTNGCEFAFPPALAQGLAGANGRQLADVEVTPKGAGLHWPQLDADLSVPDLIAGVFGSGAWMRAVARHDDARRLRPRLRQGRGESDPLTT